MGADSIPDPGAAGGSFVPAILLPAVRLAARRIARAGSVPLVQRYRGVYALATSLYRLLGGEPWLRDVVREVIQSEVGELLSEGHTPAPPPVVQNPRWAKLAGLARQGYSACPTCNTAVPDRAFLEAVAERERLFYRPLAFREAAPAVEADAARAAREGRS